MTHGLSGLTGHRAAAEQRGERVRKENEAMRLALKALVETAAQAGREERARLGRNLTEAEARQLAEMVERQFRTALEIKKAGG